MQRTGRLRWLWLSLVIVLLDRATKAVIEMLTVEGWRHEIFHNSYNSIYLVHARNPGIAFGAFADSASPETRYFLIIGSLVVMVFITWMLLARQSNTFVGAAGLALLLGGAAGNVTDRIFHGAVTDFFEVWFGTYHYPAFNVADSAITIGAVLILLDVLFGGKRMKGRKVS
jgi:signal peptidase II